MTTKSQHGGARPGAGRKPAPLKMERMITSVRPDLAAWYRAEAARRGVSISALQREALEEYRMMR